MHDDRTQIERRLSRVLHERLIPAVYRSRVPLSVRRWDAPGEPVAVAEALGADYRPAAVGDRWGPPWGTTWFELRADLPAGWSGCLVEGVVDLGFDATQPGFAAEGLVHDSDGTPVKGLHPSNRWFPVAADAESVHVFVEAAANPQITMRVPTRLGDVERNPRAGRRPRRAGPAGRRAARR